MKKNWKLFLPALIPKGVECQPKGSGTTSNFNFKSSTFEACHQAARLVHSTHVTSWNLKLSEDSSRVPTEVGIWGRG